MSEQEGKSRKRDNPKQNRQAGSLGGQETVKKYGREHMQEIGRRGAQAIKEKYGPEFYSKIGKVGGIKSGESKRRRIRESNQAGKK